MPELKNTFRLSFEVSDVNIKLTMLWVEKNKKMDVPSFCSVDTPEDIERTAKVLFPGFEAQVKAFHNTQIITKLKRDEYYDKFMPDVREVEVQGDTDTYKLKVYRNGKITCNCWAFLKWNNKKGCKHIDRWKKENPAYMFQTTKKQQWTLEQVEWMRDNADAIERIFQKQRVREIFKNVKAVSTPSSVNDD